jgi:hypothetical protein
MDLEFLNNFEKQTVAVNQRLGNERDSTLSFRKINPNLHINPEIRPNGLDWSAAQFNKRIVDRMVKEEENRQADSTKDNELAKKMDEECRKLIEAKLENKNI